MRPLLRWSVLGIGGTVWVAVVALLAAAVALLAVGWLWTLLTVHPLVAVGIVAVVLLGLLTSR